MLGNHLKTGLRSLLAQKLYALIVIAWPVARAASAKPVLALRYE